ncbi:4-demethylwyosine synthase TYW1 [Candidatus Pacearchaeota archaeon]|nr:4-demethylwyosine synthase TYW1 [Candidatus Pacearchaeota archaeon]
MIPKSIKSEFERQGYRIVGRHSAIKICLWCKNAIRGEGTCYKHAFYGIKSWRCVQMSCSLVNCSNRCLHCWRDMKLTINEEIKNPDEPKFIVEQSIREQKEILQGFKGSAKINRKRIEEAMNPLHFAISLAGEAFFYPKLAELIQEIHKRGMTSFLVSNGQLPDKISELIKQDIFPTQFYISLNAPNKKLYSKMCRPLFKDAWQRFNKSLEIMRKIGTRTVLRMTLVRDLNMIEPENYAKLIKKAQPDFVEVKSYMAVGSSRQRLPYDRMPLHSEVRGFAENIAKHAGLRILDEKKESRVVLLGKSRKNLKLKFRD